jgi:peptidyl-dipeptidase A
VNLEPNERWMNTLLHEYGHAIYDKLIDRALPYLLREPAHIITTEAIALLMGRLVQDEFWRVSPCSSSCAGDW